MNIGEQSKDEPDGNLLVNVSSSGVSQERDELMAEMDLGSRTASSGPGLTVSSITGPNTTVSGQGILASDGIGICEFCGYRGRQDSFFSKSRRFCSRVCSRSYSSSKRDKSSNRPHNKTVEKKKALVAVKTKLKLSQGSSPSAASSSAVTSKQTQFYTSSFDWSKYLDSENADAASVTCFKHCPLSNFWQNIIMDMKIEVINRDAAFTMATVYWISSVVKVAGYRAKVRYEGFGLDSSRDFWVNICSEDVHPVGWCAATGNQLVPPRTIQNKYCDWKGFLVKVLTGARTLPQNFKSKVADETSNWPLKPNMILEVVDRLCLSTMKVATVDEVIGGRLKLKYTDSKIDNDFFWCHSQSTLIHPVGWSQVVGHKIDASSDYKTSSLSKATFKKYQELDATPEMFTQMKDASNRLQKFQVGMKLEAIDPLNLSCICVSTVQKVLHNDYLMIGIDGANNENEWFCYHVTSPYILPMGFCKINNLELTPPKGSKTPFNWYEYLQLTKSVAAPVDLFDKDIPNHGYRVGMKLEAVDLMEPSLICVATIVHVVGRLLKIHFDGWESAYDQWINCQSPDIYPIGWCEIIKHHLEGPRPAELFDASYRSLKKRSKAHVFKGNRKKRRNRLFNSLSGTAYSPNEESVKSSLSQHQLYDSFSRSSPLDFGDGQLGTEKRDILCEEMPTLSPLHSTSGSERILTDMPDLMEAESFESNQLSGRLSSFQMANTSLSGDTMGEDDDIEEQAEEEEDEETADVFNLRFTQRHNESQVHNNRKMQSLFTSAILMDAKNSEADSIVDANQRETVADRCIPESAKEEENSFEESLDSQQPNLNINMPGLMLDCLQLTERIRKFRRSNALVTIEGSHEIQMQKFLNRT